jgi:beta-glucosidase
VSRVDQRVNLAGALVPVAGPSQPTSRFTDSSARWSGYFTPAQAGKHLLYLQAFRGEGGYRMLVDDRIVVDDWEVAKTLVDQASLTLTAAPHRIVVEQYRRRESMLSGARLRLGIVHEDSVVDPAAKSLAAGADVVIAAAGFDAEIESEGGDRTFALPIGQDALIRSLVDANRKTVVTITSGGGVDMTAWVNRVPAIVETWFAGQEGGTALAQLLAGDANFSGRLPATFERAWEDNPNHDSYYPPKASTKVPYTSGVFVGYRGFDQKNTPVMFPFGFGLSYTEFAYSNLAITPKPGAKGPAFEVTFDVKNVGGRAGADVAQVYVAPVKPNVPRPRKELKGFAKVVLASGETRHVRIDLDARAFSYWDVTVHQWQADAGEYTVLVGPSSAETPLSGKVTVPASAQREGAARQHP